MDVAIGASHVSFHKAALIYFASLAALQLPLQIFSNGGWVYAAKESGRMHWSGKKTEWDRKNNRVTLVGNAVFRQEGESLSADYMVLDLDKRSVYAKGNCVYIANDSIIYGTEMLFDLEARSGTIYSGRVANEKFTLLGDRIEKIGSNRFKVENSEYSTCRDCARSWTIAAGKVDMEIEGYAYMSDVVGRVKDSSIFWMPYLILPMKTQRQTGLLFPKFRFVDGSFRIVQPFFWAISQSTDMTIGVGDFADRGIRLEWEGRYRLSARSAGTANVYYLRDKLFNDYLSEPSNFSNYPEISIRPTSHRWAIDVSQTQEFPLGIDQKLRLIEVSDSLYPIRMGDVPGNGEAYVSSEFMLSHASNEFSAFVAARRYRNLLYPNPQIFDPQTVQVYPSAVVASNSKFLFGTPIAGSLSVGIKNFTRTSGDFDLDPWSLEADPSKTVPVPGIDPVRKATRISFNPSLYTTLRPWGVMSIVPSVEYRGYFYSFHQSLPNLVRGYLLFKTDVFAQLEKIYEDPNNAEAPKSKHLIRPLLTYHLIPTSTIHEPSHPFISQMQYANSGTTGSFGGWGGYQFDDDDVIPLDAPGTSSNYFMPEGNSISYGFTTQYIRKRAPNVYNSDWYYQTSVELKTGQTLNFREFDKPVAERQPFSQYFADLIFLYDKWSASLNYTYSPNVPVSPDSSRHAVTSAFTYNFDKSIRQKILLFDRSFSLGYTYARQNGTTNNMRAAFSYSISDYIMPTISASWDFYSNRMLSGDAAIKFQSPSQCWTFDLGVNRSVCAKERPTDTGYCTVVRFDVGLNFTGSGFGVLPSGYLPQNSSEKVQR